MRILVVSEFEVIRTAFKKALTNNSLVHRIDTASPQYLSTVRRFDRNTSMFEFDVVILDVDSISRNCQEVLHYVKKQIHEKAIMSSNFEEALFIISTQSNLATAPEMFNAYSGSDQLCFKPINANKIHDIASLVNNNTNLHSVSNSTQ